FIPSRQIPVFLPWLNGERSLEWNSELRPSWHGRNSDHTPAELQRSVMEGVVFNLAQYVEVIEKSSGVRANQVVLSGNGFLDPAVFRIDVLLSDNDAGVNERTGVHFGRNGFREPDAGHRQREADWPASAGNGVVSPRASARVIGSSVSHHWKVCRFTGFHPFP